MIFWRLWGSWKAVLGGFGAMGHRLGASGAGHEASKSRLGGVLKNFGGVLKPSRCVLESLEGVWRAPKQAQASFEEGLKRFLPGF